jgi:hypothetical protein
VIHRNRFQGAHLSDDEVGVANCLMLSMQPKRMGGYSLANASQDQYLALTIRTAADDHESIVTSVQPWNSELDPTA